MGPFHCLNKLEELLYPRTLRSFEPKIKKKFGGIFVWILFLQLGFTLGMIH
jgi:hypothetical protein